MRFCGTLCTSLPPKAMSLNGSDDDDDGDDDGDGDDNCGSSA
eukprot:CAMPEP_0170173726 /NCGR_PEP_ID=MMETSP0040_2-20121228/6994_1 /TAXON_ID=641309 /ORGANISM="Lotharella oceanica, Strain CCMP622" /LENGTH=41 /DNA_ID= /DNA_START= /DNA_END= /DNA_ORIENTATION=